jgi:hypothetical protein
MIFTSVYIIQGHAMASHPIYQFYVELKDFRPKLWRRFQVQSNVTLARLGYILMTLFEMQASHLFCLEYMPKGSDMPNLRFALPDTELEPFHDVETLDAAEITLWQLFRDPDEKLLFLYDYGDSWECALKLEKVVTDKALPGRELPRVLAGHGYGIIEDCGGPRGLTEIGKACKHKEGKEYQEFCHWQGRTDLDLLTFDLEDMNFRLKKVPRIYEGIYEYYMEPSQRSLAILERRYKK